VSPAVGEEAAEPDDRPVDDDVEVIFVDRFVEYETERFPGERKFDLREITRVCLLDRS
jgi:hypothetical protein